MTYHEKALDWDLEDLSLVLTLLLLNFVTLDKSHPFPGPEFLHGRSKGLVYMVLNIFLPAQSIH